jgi:hypothetical protein
MSAAFGYRAERAACASMSRTAEQPSSRLVEKASVWTRLALRTTSSSARRRVGGYCFVPDCERVLVAEGATAGTSDWATRDSTTS